MCYDPTDDSTGLSSVYTVFEGHEIMFHVSTLLPYTTANEQQVCVYICMYPLLLVQLFALFVSLMMECL